MVRMIGAEMIGDLPFRFALGAILAVSAIFVFNGSPPGAVPSETPGVSPTAAPASLSQQPSRPEATRYRVRAGDTLRSIAVRFYGDEGLWQKIYRANREVIEPENIAVGTVLIIPSP